MSTNGGGAFVAILLSVPLSAVAVMSVFGIPQFTSVVASNGHDEEPGFEDEGHSGRSRARQRSGAREIDDGRQDPLDPHAAANWSDDSPRNSRARRLLPRTARTSDLDDRVVLNSPGRIDDVGGDAARALRPVESAGESFDDKPFAPHPQGTDNIRKKALNLNASADDAFVQAISSLSSIGVDRWHLEPGLDSGTILFVCLIDDRAASGAIHRFESEQGEPLAAVRDVIQQISEWRTSSSGHLETDAGRR